MTKDFDARDIAQILKIEHDNPLPCDKGAWVQWLMTQIGNEKVKILGIVDGGLVKAYMVMIENIDRPIFDSVAAIYIHSAGARETKEMVEAGIEWAKSTGAKNGIASVPPDHSEQWMESLGAKKKSINFEWEF
jgi:hypothetical protein